MEAGEAGLHPPLILQAPLVSPLVLVSLPRSIKSHLLGDGPGPQVLQANATAPLTRCSAGYSVLGYVTRVGSWDLAWEYGVVGTTPMMSVQRPPKPHHAHNNLCKPCQEPRCSPLENGWTMVAPRCRESPWSLQVGRGQLPALGWSYRRT